MRAALKTVQHSLAIPEPAKRGLVRIQDDIVKAWRAVQAIAKEFPGITIDTRAGLPRAVDRIDAAHVALEALDCEVLDAADALDDTLPELAEQFDAVASLAGRVDAVIEQIMQDEGATELTHELLASAACELRKAVQAMRGIVGLDKEGGR